MLLELFLFLILGIIGGTITGLIPGIHINLIGIIFVSSIALNFPQTYFIVFIVSLSITHTFVDFIPSIFLGCPDTDTELGVLPGHKLVQKGKGFEAILLSSYGSLAAIFVLLLIALPSFILIKQSYSFVSQLIPYLLILFSFLLIFSEKNKLTALKIFLLTGLLGYSISFLEINQPLLPLLTGLFGSSIIIQSIKNKTKIPEQKITKTSIPLKKPLLASIVSAPLCSFLPGLGSGQAAVIGNMITKEGDKGFLTLLGITNTLVMGFSMITLFAIEKTRTGTALFIKEILPSLEIKFLFLIILTILFSGIISFFLTIKLGKIFSKKINKIPYRKLAITTLIILSIIVLIVSGIKGFFVLIVSTLTGTYSLKFKIRRTNMMGSLMIPSILWSFGLG